MADAGSLQDLDQRIAVIRDNLRELTEQAAAFSGAQDEARAADRIAEQQQALEGLLKEREAFIGNRNAPLNERDALPNERDALLKEREGLLKEREALRKQRPTRS
jgi:hypothetical protein